MKIFLKTFDIVIINETHFNVRIKCPEGFIFEGRSEKIESKTPRGGVAIYRNIKCSINIDIICGTLRDCVVFEVRNSNLVIAAQYIPPSNSIYFNDIYMENLSLLYNKYKTKNFLLLGDLNARIGDILYKDPTIKHNINPDNVINSNGRQLRKWVDENDDMILINGLQRGGNFDSKFTFYRGTARSQNDLVFSNELRSISSMKIMNKQIQSDHCPLSIECTINLVVPLDLVHDCAYHTFSNDQYDINRRLKQPIIFDRVDIPLAVQKLKTPYDIGNENNNITAVKLTNYLYECCRNSYKEKEQHIEISGNLLNCKSANFKAIADANLFTYNTLSQQNHPEADLYLDNWAKFEDLARKAKNNEMNIRVNKTWRDKRYDGKQLWKAIDWKGRAETKVEKPAHEADTMKYFTGIFQSTKTKDHAIISDISEDMSKYENYVSALDDPITIEELNTALKEIGTGVSLDGIPPAIATILPLNIQENILDLLNRVFNGNYPDEWCKNILHSIKKDGHTPRDPKLRGIAIGPFLCRIYDIIIDRRFCTWYTPNREQAAGKKGQGCPLQIFMLVLLIDYSREMRKDLFVGFLDYEKAFDYANRAGILTCLMNDRCGSGIIKAISNMFTTSTYFPKSNKNYLSNGITTDYGVTQGRRSSGSFFSYYVSDMPKALNDMEYTDFLNPLSLAQLADDTAIYAELVDNLIVKFRKIFKYSREKKQVANVKKTVYANFTSNPILTPIKIDEDISLDSIDPNKGYKYIGFYTYPTNDISYIIQRNVDKRMINFSKFHAWLSVNESTPIDTKLLVYDSCVLGAVLNSAEAWGDMRCVEAKLKENELTALRAILGVKKGTTIDIIYHELNRCSIMSTILDRQYSFFEKLNQMSSDDAIVKLVMEMFDDASMISYYKDLQGNYGIHEKEEREVRIRTSENSMCRIYCDLDCISKCQIYSSMLTDYYRTPISRWRVSNHRLQIEVGRYTKPKTPRMDRVCSMCNVLEDEQHVIFACPRYQRLREKYKHLIDHNDVRRFLNPDYQNMKGTANFIRDIETRRTELKLT